MSTHNICFYGELTKIIRQLSSHPYLFFCRVWLIRSLLIKKASLPYKLCSQISFWYRTNLEILGHGEVCHLSFSRIIVHVFEPPYDKTKKINCAPSEDSDQPGLPPSLIRVFIVCSVDSQESIVSSCRQWRLWSVWADTQADLSLRWAHRSFCWVCHAAAHMFFALKAEWQVSHFKDTLIQYSDESWWYLKWKNMFQ